MNKYLLFSGNIFYPSGGWEDFKGYFDSIEQAKLLLKDNSDYEWAHIVKDNNIVLWGHCPEWDGKWIWRDTE